MLVDNVSIELFHRAWGNPSLPPLICIHGLTRNSLDFEYIGNALMHRFHVLALDMPGRGETLPLADPAFYNNGFYAKLILQWLDERNIKTCRWIGTSMGGMIGMIIAATDPTRISRMVMNDIGAVIPASALARLKTYVGREMVFATRAIAEARVHEIYASFGLTEERHWQHLMHVSMREAPDGSWHMRYDARIAENFAGAAEEDMDLWPLFNAVTCPVLLLRGEYSDLLLRETALKMAEKPNVKYIEIAGCGHAPALYNDEQIALINQFL